MDTLLDSKTFGQFTVEIHQDGNCESPLEYCEEVCKLYQYGRKDYRNAIHTGYGEDEHIHYLATSIYPDFPDTDSAIMNKHREAIVKKYFARSQVPTQDRTWLEIIVNIAEWTKECSSMSAQKYVDSIAKTYRSWLEGECCGFMVKDEDGNDLDSCWGFYSWEDAYASAKESFPTRNDQYYFDRSENNV